MNSLALEDIKKLDYEICRYSSYSTSYLPENILEDCPSDQASRWSAQTNIPPQFLTLKLKRPAIVKKIKFGKFEKSHVCNLKKFHIYGGLEEERMVLLLESGLKNDSRPEIFNLRCITENGSENLPILYLKINPLLSWGPSFNFSIWYVELHGQDDTVFTDSSLRNYNMLREVEIVKLCLKHFRQQGYDSAFKALQKQTNVQLEHNLISDLHKSLVVDGNFEKAEDYITDYVHEGLMDEYLANQDYKHSWKLLKTNCIIQPGTRGGHQLVMDTNKNLVYLFGGWDGYKDLSDLWAFDVNTRLWQLIFEHSEEFNGPSPRSCHKMVFDNVSGNLFMLGRYLDSSIRTTDCIKSDFYLYDTSSRTWLQICDDTSQVGGPQLIYDHQMCIDTDKRTIYIFGGKILTPRSVNHPCTTEPEYSGLFSYHIATNTWIQIFVDCHHPTASQPDVLSIKSRVTHCMVFHCRTRKLYVYGGQRGKEDMEEFITYDVDTMAVEVLNKERSNNDIKYEPSPGFTLRATIDCDRDEIYVFSSLSKQKDRRDVQQIDSSNSFWVYSLHANKWSRIYTCKYKSTSTLEETTGSEPIPRYAHQLIYNEEAKVHYLFGGNPGKSNSPQLRLDDFWILTLEKPKREEILANCRYMIRKLQYEEITQVDPMKALHYLRNNVSKVIDHSNPEQLSNFHKLASLLFKPEPDSIMGEQSLLSTIPIEKKKMRTNEENEDCSQNSDSAADLSLESIESSSTQSDKTYLMYKKSGGKRDREQYFYQLKSRRAFLFNKLSQLMPSNMVQPEQNLSDFVLI